MTNQEQKTTPTLQEAGGSKKGFDIWIGKDFSWYWKIIQIPVIVGACLIVTVWLLWKIPFLGWILAAFGSVLTWLVVLAMFFWTGWQAYKKYQANMLQTLMAGAWAGALVGFVYGILYYHYFFIWGMFSDAITGAVVALIAFLVGGGKTEISKKPSEGIMTQPTTQIPPQYQEAVKSAKQYLASGKKDEEIKELFKKSGWTDEQVNYIVEIAKKY